MVGFGCVVWIIFGLVFFSSGEVLYIVIYKDLIKYLDAQATLKNCMNVIELENKISKQVVLIWKKKKSKTYDWNKSDFQYSGEISWIFIILK